MNMDEFKSRTGLNFFLALFSLLLEWSLLRRSLSYSYIEMAAAAIDFLNSPLMLKYPDQLR